MTDKPVPAPAMKCKECGADVSYHVEEGVWRHAKKPYEDQSFLCSKYGYPTVPASSATGTCDPSYHGGFKKLAHVEPHAKTEQCWHWEAVERQEFEARLMTLLEEIAVKVVGARHAAKVRPELHPCGSCLDNWEEIGELAKELETARTSKTNQQP